MPLQVQRLRKWQLHACRPTRNDADSMCGDAVMYDAVAGMSQMFGLSDVAQHPFVLLLYGGPIMFSLRNLIAHLQQSA